MELIAFLRRFYIRTTNFTHGYQGQSERQLGLYRLWAPLYDISLRIDPGYTAGIRRMVDAVVEDNDTVLDIGCGTGLATILAAHYAKRVVGIDPGSEMLAKLRLKIDSQQVTHIDLIEGFFPDALASTALYDVVISSFALVHIERDKRGGVYKAIFNHLKSGGRISTFSAQGEIASAFETKAEVSQNLGGAGFQQIQITDFCDIYRVAAAVKQ